MDTLEDVLRALPSACQALEAGLPGLPDTSGMPPSLAWAADILALKLQAQEAGVPLAVHLGGQGTASIVTATLVTGVDADVKDSVGSAARAVAPGLAGGLHKWKVGSGPVDEDLARILAFVRSHPESRLRLDANGAWTVAQASRFLEGLFPVKDRMDFLEEPVANPSDWDAVADVADDLGIPLAADEGLRVPDAHQGAMSSAAERARVHVFKPSLHGSWTRLTQDVQRAKKSGKRVVFSSAYESGIGMADLVHVSAALSNEPVGFGTHAWLACDLVSPTVGERLRQRVVPVAGISAFESPTSVCPVHLAARSNPGATAVSRAGDRSVTWAELDARIEHACRHPAFRPGVRLDVRAERTLEFVIVLFAAMRRGVVLHPADSRTSEPVADLVLLATGGVGGASPAPNAAAAADLSTSEKRSFRTTTIGPEGRLLMRTSGSTGTPAFVDLAWTACRQSARAVNRRVAFESGDAWAWTLQPHHVGGIAIPIRCAEAGATLHLPATGSDADFGAATHLSLVEVQLARLVAAHRTAPKKWKTIMVGGGALAVHLLEEAVRKGFPVRTTYGMTETASTVTCSEIWTPADVEALKDDRGMCTARLHAGNPLEGYDVRLEPEAGTARIFVKTPFAEWIRTSDRGERGPGGHLTVTGRLDRVLISGGENVPLAAIETALERLLEVQRARVVAVPDATWGERPVAFVVATPFDEAALRNALTAELPPFMVPDRIHPEPPPPDGQAKWTLDDLTALAVTLGRTTP
jgi:O-succinylbenzoic acid--CoA ligase